MAKKPIGEVPTIALQPPVKVIENPPSATAAEALANRAAQVDKAK
jgi:hypothetical protein